MYRCAECGAEIYRDSVNSRAGRDPVFRAESDERTFGADGHTHRPVPFTADTIAPTQTAAEWQAGR